MTELEKGESERREASASDPDDLAHSSGVSPREEAMLQAVRLEFSGPLPHPQLLAQYNDALSDGANRVVRLAESQAKHRQRLESRGQFFAFILAMVALAGGILLIALGHSIAGLVPLIASIGGLGGIFIYREVVTRRIDKALESSDQ